MAPIRFRRPSARHRTLPRCGFHDGCVFCDRPSERRKAAWCRCKRPRPCGTRSAGCLSIERSDAPALRRRFRMFFLAMHGVERDDMARNIEFFQQFLLRRYLVGLFIDHDMRQHQRRIDGKSAEYLSCFGIVEGVETALERFAVKRQNACAGGRCAAVEVCRVLAKDPLDIRRVQPLQNITDRCVGGWPLPGDLESFVQPFELNLDNRANAPVGVGSRLLRCPTISTHSASAPTKRLSAKPSASSIRTTLRM